MAEAEDIDIAYVGPTGDDGRAVERGFGLVGFEDVEALCVEQLRGDEDSGSESVSSGSSQRTLADLGRLVFGACDKVRPVDAHLDIRHGSLVRLLMYVLLGSRPSRVSAYRRE
jgi:hypothetical protein